MDQDTPQFTNALIEETSPYLLQHAHNPVDWHAWNDATLAKAKEQNKPLLISIGYSACHWCHVMEHESFEDTAVAAIMNKYFINVKVDREERPDIDQIYMTGVQLMTGSGGWPLNTIALPDGKPFWGGTYFKNEDWKRILTQLAELYENDYAKVEEYALQLTQGIAQTDLIKPAAKNTEFTQSFLATNFEEWSRSFDKVDGGHKRAPKFPMPNNYEFLLKYGHLSANEEALEHVELTLSKMANGGIYDQLGGGFARYSVDGYWKVPHFEKMLYDNGQLIGLYARAYQKFKNPLFKQVVSESIAFINRELSDVSGAFFSALDADSEGEEGKFYVWKIEELKSLLLEDYKLFADYYRITKDALWEHGNHILMQTEKPEKIAKKYDLELPALEIKIEKLKTKLMAVRDQRVRPGLDDKCLTSWNALMLSGLADAYAVFGEPEYLDRALANANFLVEKQLRQDGGLWHSYKAGRSTINGYLEDYAATIESFIKLYQISLDEKWLRHANALSAYSIKHFYNAQSGMFYFTSNEDAALIARKMDVDDNVIPASNSIMAKNLASLSLYFDNKNYEDIANQMLKNMKAGFEKYPSGHSNWGQLILEDVFPKYELIVCGTNAESALNELRPMYLPNVLIGGSKKESNLPLMENRFVENETLIYLCQDRVCKLPTSSMKEAIAQLP
ncbi:MAG: hypothetical protein ACI8P7_000918 [Candidatus Azotimanducaceae bacterium]|jgi:uncharacterized protein YyaL (SSP411 family)